MPDILDIEKKKANGSILGGVGGIASAVVSGLDSIFGLSSKRQERAQKRLMDKQQEQWKEQQDILARQQFEQWTRENEYNDPTNYYKRLFDGAAANGITKAGVLGNMPAGSVGQSATGVTAPGSTSGTGVGGVQQQSISAGMNNVLAGMRQRAEINLIEAQVRNLDQQNKESDSRIDLNKLNEGYIYQLTALTYEQAVSEPIKRAGQVLSNVLQSFDVETYDSRFIADINSKWAQIQSAYASAYESWQSARKIGKEVEWFDTNAMQVLEVSRSQVAVNWAMAKAQQELAEKYDAETAQQILASDEFKKGMQSRLNILQNESEWAPLYQFTQTIGGVSDFKFGVLNFANNGGRFFGKEYDPRWQYFDIIEEVVSDIERNDVYDRKFKLKGKKPIKK